MACGIRVPFLYESDDIATSRVTWMVFRGTIWSAEPCEVGRVRWRLVLVEE